MTKQELKVYNLLIDTFNEFVKLKPQHPDERRDFTNAIHTCQYLLGMRIARKAEPKKFPIKE